MLISLLRRSHVSVPLRRLALCASFVAAAAVSAVAQTASPYSQIIVFGDSLSDTGNFAHLTSTQFGLTYPGLSFDYANGRFTSSDATTPGSTTYSGVWHEQLAARFLNLPPSTDSLDGGLDFAFGDATTEDGTRQVDIGPSPAGGELYVYVDNMGQQVTNYLANNAVDPNALFVVWGGANDLFADDTAGSVNATAVRMAALVTRLAQAGARTFLVPNVPPLGQTPEYSVDPTQSAALNAASASYRDQLNAMLDATVSNLNAQGVSITVVRLDVYSLFQTLTVNASTFGFSNVTDMSRGNASANVDSYLFWDGVHPTTAGHNQIAQDAADLLPGAHPAFFNGEALLSGSDFGYLAFAGGQTFGYYSYQFFPYLYSTSLGFEYFVDAHDNANGAYLYDFGLQSFLYTSPALYPYFFNFQANAFYFYVSGSTNPRQFYNVRTGQLVRSSN